MVKQRQHLHNGPAHRGAAAATQRPYMGGAELARRAARAFTLIELLVVMAISIILLGLLFGPIIQSFNLTRRTRAITQAQDAARFGLERLTRELGEASYVFDNSATPLILPFNPNNTGSALFLKRFGQTGAALTFPSDSTGTPDYTPAVLFTKIDFVRSATGGPGTGTGKPIDPTTGGPVGGAQLRFPLAPGKRITRYFIGLRRNLDAAGNPLYYQNVYEFAPRRGGDSEFNPFVLYRVEFDPTDANLINQANFNRIEENFGGLNDPDFFYNTNVAANGKTYAANWAAIAAPVLASENGDLIVWRKNGQGDYFPDNPFRTTVSFSPATVIGDTATPGFLTASESESPGAVPSLYTTRYPQWALPYTLTIYRASTITDPRDPLTKASYGSLKIRVALADVGGGAVRPQAFLDNASGSLDADAQRNVYVALSPSSGKLFVKTPNLTFQVDPGRGRIETGFPPLAGNVSGVPFYQTVSGGATAPMTTTYNGTAIEPIVGDVVPTVFRLNTRDPEAGTMVTRGGLSYTMPLNQGILKADLLADEYYEIRNPQPALGAAAEKRPSPLKVFGFFRIARGTERVYGPDGGSASDTQVRSLISFYRAPALNAFASTAISADKTTNLYPSFAQGRNSYRLNEDLNDYALRFDIEPQNADFTPGVNTTVPGLFAPGNTNAAEQREVQATYTWQNNYARNAAGEPININGVSSLTPVGTGQPDAAAQPEADVIKVDYATRLLINLSLGVRVYDASSGDPQSIQVSDKVQVNNNVGR